MRNDDFIELDYGYFFSLNILQLILVEYFVELVNTNTHASI